MPTANLCARCGLVPAATEPPGSKLCAACATPMTEDDALPFEPEPAPTHEKRRVCGVCGNPISDAAVVCLSCGFDHHLRRRRHLLDRGDGQPGVIRRGDFCGGCGFSLAGLPTPRCPECGAYNRDAPDYESFSERRRRRGQAHARSLRRALVLIPAGLAGSLVLDLATGGWTATGHTLIALVAGPVLVYVIPDLPDPDRVAYRDPDPWGLIADSALWITVLRIQGLASVVALGVCVVLALTTVRRDLTWFVAAGILLALTMIEFAGDERRNTPRKTSG